MTTGHRILSAACLLAIGPGALAQTLVAHYELDAKSGTQAVDSVCGGNPGTWSGGVFLDQFAAAPGTVRSVRLDGLDGHALVPDNPALNPLRNDFTVSAWVKPTSFKTWERVFGNQDSWAFGLQNDRILFTTRAVKDYISAPAVALNVWSHVAVVFDANNTATFYADGIQVGAPIVGGSPANAPLPDWFIGAKDATPTSGEHFAGFIDEIQIYNGSLSAAQIFGLFARPAGTLGSPGQVSYCSAKLASCGSRPTIGSSGVPSASASAGSGFEVVCAGARAGKFGVLVYSDSGRGALPFGGGTLCVTTSSLAKTHAVRDTTGFPGGCDGTLVIDMNTFASGTFGGAPLPGLSIPGTQINCQWWGRDNVANGALLSDGLEYFVCP